MVKKRILAFLLLIIWIMSAATGVLAATTVRQWCSDESWVYYRELDGSYYVSTLGTDSSFNTNFRSAVSHARDQWSSALNRISVTETSFNYALNYVYGGTKEELSGIFPELADTTGGRTYFGPTAFVENITYIDINGNSSVKSVYALTSGGMMCVINDSTSTLANYQNIATHEMGHLLGWYGHSINTTDVMWRRTTQWTTLSQSEKKHLSQIYDLFY